MSDKLLVDHLATMMKTGYGKFVVTNSIPCLRVVLADGTISSASVTLTAAAKRQTYY